MGKQIPRAGVLHGVLIVWITRELLEAVRVGWTAPLVAVRDVVNRTSLGIYKRNSVIGVESSTAHSVRCFRFSRLFEGSATIV